jgi:hypothetical protein
LLLKWRPAVLEEEKVKIEGEKVDGEGEGEVKA